MTTTHTQDRRRNERVTLAGPLAIRSQDGLEPASLRNLSVAGLSCACARPFPEMSTVLVSLDLPALPGEAASSVRLELTGAVVRCHRLPRGTGRRRYELALYFTGLAPQARSALSSLLEARLR
jgi:hypothetical protein